MSVAMLILVPIHMSVAMLIVVLINMFIAMLILVNRYRMSVSRMTEAMFLFGALSNPVISSFMTYHEINIVF